jgi:hypothetical protein
MSKPLPSLPLFTSAEVSVLEAERTRLVSALERMRRERRHGAILKTEFRLQRVTGQILALAQGKEIRS